MRISKISRLNYYSEGSRAIRRGLENIYVSKQDSGGVPLPVSNKARSKREEEQSDAKLEGEEEKEREIAPRSSNSRALKSSVFII